MTRATGLLAEAYVKAVVVEDRLLRLVLLLDRKSAFKRLSDGVVGVKQSFAHVARPLSVVVKLLLNGSFGFVYGFERCVVSRLLTVELRRHVAPALRHLPVGPLARRRLHADDFLTAV